MGIRLGEKWWQTNLRIEISLIQWGKEACTQEPNFVGLAYQGKDIVFRFIIEYGSSRDFGP
jgi:hypothetical protein